MVGDEAVVVEAFEAGAAEAVATEVAAEGARGQAKAGEEVKVRAAGLIERDAFLMISPG